MKTNEIKHIAVNACLMPALAADGCHVTTVEGIGTVKDDNLHPIQKAMTDLHGSQCGFCTPGIIVAIYSLYANNPCTDYIEEHLDGNLCRCTGYRPIWDAARSLCEDAQDVVRGPCGTACRECPERHDCEQDCNVHDKEKDQLICSSSKEKMGLKESFEESKVNWTEQPNQMFPKELLDCTEVEQPLMIVDQVEYQGSGTWFKPTTLPGLLSLLKEFKDGYKIVVGNTEVGIGRFYELLFRLLSRHAVFKLKMILDLCYRN
jgi:xanthine dehydrogenase/oxidase